ncbi:MAG: AAA family ATPase [Bacteroidetes bacterium]|nr:AAA family ATPase [Bacteroidota bacterium]
MIQFVEVTGFKSLNNFKIELKKGLNILVGPNGSGKTNIISLFEFLSHIAQREVQDAVGLSGGAGSIFRKIGTVEFSNEIHITTRGNCLFDKNRYFNYLYEFKICVIKEKGLIRYSYQRIIGQLSNKQALLSGNSKNIDLNIEQSVNSDGEIEVKLLKLDRRKYKSHMYRKNPDNEELIDFLTRSGDNQKRSLVQQLFRFLSHIELIFGDLLGGETFNIIPTKVKQPEDIANEPGIKKDGTGLASTLYHIQNNLDLRRSMSYGYMIRRRRHINPKTYERIEKLTNLANNSIKRIEVVNNPFDNQLQVKIHISTDKENIVLPLSAMSDGTIKWITLITAILTTTQIFSIEEPENYLHPWMQAQIVDIMRDTYASKNENSFIIMSTHSETLLNHSKPEEVIIVKLEHGVTSAERVKNAKMLNEEISKTGFGLGYYYFTGGLDNE